MAEDCVRVAEELDNPSSLTVALFSKGKLHLRRGEFPEAITTLDRAVEFLRTFHIPFLLPLLTSAMGLTY
ncbi:MAG: hypothetical protein GTO41_18050, partial [Burkholderiales bacterium]|nr:hypothetical protein [Burkholderiales bacterium]